MSQSKKQPKTYTVKVRIHEEELPAMMEAFPDRLWLTVQGVIDGGYDLTFCFLGDPDEE